VRKKCYDAYFRPKGYRFEDVLKSIEVALAQEKFVAINYFNSPGFTDTPQEVDALIEFLHKYPIHMIQWRNLNFDPIRYWKEMNAVDTHGEPIGMEKLLNRVHRQFPKLKFGYFNPPKEDFGKKTTPNQT
jgi:pyruvate-formate lyase-activating enzyme